MIDAAAELDAKPQARTAGRRALIATLVYAGLRIGEATALRWGDVDLANGRISVGDAKTEAGIRLVDILPALRDELLSHRHAHASAKPDALVFPTSSGSRRDKDNARERVIRPVVAHADALLGRRGREPLPAGVTAHKLRHTFASILFVRGEDPPYVMAQLGHTDPAFHVARLRPRDAPRRGRQGGPQGARRGPSLVTSGPDDPSEPVFDLQRLLPPVPRGSSSQSA
jgi:integrase